jgi:hypothetical protein
MGNAKDQSERAGIERQRNPWPPVRTATLPRSDLGRSLAYLAGFGRVFLFAG